MRRRAGAIGERAQYLVVHELMQRTPMCTPQTPSTPIVHVRPRISTSHQPAGISAADASRTFMTAHRMDTAAPQTRDAQDVEPYREQSPAGTASPMRGRYDCAPAAASRPTESGAGEDEVSSGWADAEMVATAASEAAAGEAVAVAADEDEEGDEEGDEVDEAIIARMSAADSPLAKRVGKMRTGQLKAQKVVQNRKKLFEKNSAAFGPAFAGSGPGGAAVSVRRRKGTADDEILVSGGGGFGAKVLGAGGSGGGSCSSSRPSSQAVRRRAEIAGLNRTS